MEKPIGTFLLLTLLVTHKGLCYPSGAPDSACSDMIPNHGVNGQTGTSPYRVVVGKSYYQPGETIAVSINSSGIEMVKGFLLQARKVGSNSTTGMFSDNLPRGVKHVDCGNNKGAVTHSNRLSLKTVHLEWTAPSDLTGNISFVATVVKDTTTFWIKLESPELYQMDVPSSPSTPITSISDEMVMPSSMTKSMPVLPSTTIHRPITLISDEMVTPSSMTKSMPVLPSTTIHSCKQENSKCDGAHHCFPNGLFLLFTVLLLAILQM